MIYYKLFPGDYLRDTGHLSLTEHGVYALMLHIYYSTEKPLPAGARLYRLLRCEHDSDRQAVDSVAAEFWTETPTGLVNKRAMIELEDAGKMIQRNRENGKGGGRPRRNRGSK